MSLNSITYVSDNKCQVYEQVKDGKTVYKAKIELFRTGVFEHMYYGKLNIDLNYLKTLKKNWEYGVHPTQVSFDKDHNHASGATAWLPKFDVDSKALRIKKKQMMAAGKERSCYVLEAEVELTELGYSLIKSDMYRYFSAEISPNYKSYEVFYELDSKGQVSEEERKEYGPTLVGGALTNFPFIIGMEPISLSFSVDVSSAVKPEDINPMSAYGTKESLMLFSEMFAKAKPKMKDDKPDEEEEEEEEFSDDEDEDDMPGEVESEDEDEDDVDPEKPKKPTKKKKKLEKPKDEDKKDKDKNEYDLNGSGSPPVQLGNNPTQDTFHTEKNKMQLAQLFAAIAGKDVKAQIAILEPALISLSTDDKTLVEALLADKRDLAARDAALANEIQLRLSKEKEVDQLRLNVADLAVKAEQNKQLAYAQQVEVFCNELEKDNHYPAIVSHVKDLLSNVKADQRDQKFSVVSGSAEKTVDLFSILKDVLAQIPADGRFSPEKDGEQAFTATGGKAPEPKPENKQDKYELAFANYGASALGVASVDELRASADWKDKFDDKGEILVSRTAVQVKE